MNTPRIAIASSLVALFAAVGLSATDASAQTVTASCAHPVVTQVQPTQPVVYAQPVINPQPVAYAQPVAYPSVTAPVYVRPATQPVYVRPATQPVYVQPFANRERARRIEAARIEAARIEAARIEAARIAQLRARHSTTVRGRFGHAQASLTVRRGR